MSNRILTIAIFLLMSVNSSYAVQWTDYNSAVATQKKNQKPIMLNIVSSHCGYCHKMQREVFDDKNMSKWLEDRFIMVKLDSRADDIPLNLSVKVTPTFIFLRDSKVIKTIPGSWNIEDFKSLVGDIK